MKYLVIYCIGITYNIVYRNYITYNDKYNFKIDQFKSNNTKFL